MHSPLLSHEINAFIKEITETHPGIETVWLIGSRANACARDDSDWDFIAFGNSAVLNSLRSSNRFSRDDVDFLVVTDGDNFQAPWPNSHNPGHFKSGHLFKRLGQDGIIYPGWRWQFDSRQIANYVGTKIICGNVSYKKNKAYCVFPTQLEDA